MSRASITRARRTARRDSHASKVERSMPEVPMSGDDFTALIDYLQSLE